MVESITAQNLYEKWSQIQAKQGIIGKTWNGFKELTNLGQSKSDCNRMLNAYKNGRISITEAMEYIEEFEKKQNDMTNLITNISTGVASIAIATTAAAGGPIGWGLAALKGAPIGAAVKTGLKTLDRATNGIDNDALDKDELIKDAVSGAVTGTTSAVSSHIFAGVKAAKRTMTVAQGLKTSIKNGTECGLLCGGLSGASSYLTDVALDEDKKYSFGELAKNTGLSAFISGTVGAFVGGSVYGIEGAMGNLGKETASNLSHTIARDSFLSSSRKVLGNAERQLITA